MPPTSPTPTAASSPLTAAARIGCVSYLNARPLIEGLDEADDLHVRYDVPARLLDDLLAGEVDVALCPVIDFYRSPKPLRIVPAGAIGALGSTMTVRLYSRVPVEKVSTIHADTDSHTSVALLHVLMNKRFGLHPEVIDYDAREHVADGKDVDSPEAVLLIGDKVVTDSPNTAEYPHQIDLSEVWREWTGLPFVFAVWMSLDGVDLGELPRRLEQVRIKNQTRLHAIATKHAPRHGWPDDLAHRYLAEILHFEVGSDQLRAIERFGELAGELGIIDTPQPLRLHRL